MTHQQLCQDAVAWAKVVGQLAQHYPRVSSFGIDDFSHNTRGYSGEEIAEVESTMRQLAPWLSFVPTFYHSNLGSDSTPPDFARTVDTLLYYFRNEKHWQCLTDPCGTDSVKYASEEYQDAKALLPAGRKLQVGMYWVALWSSTPPEVPSTRYDYDLTRLTREMPDIGGVTAYAMLPVNPAVDCANDLTLLSDPHCTLARVFGDKPQSFVDTDLTNASSAPLAAGSPFAYVFPRTTSRT